MHVRTNNSEKEGKSAISGKYRRLVKTLNERGMDWTDCVIGDITSSCRSTTGWPSTHKYRRYYGGGSKLRRHVVKNVWEDTPFS